MKLIIGADLVPTKSNEHIFADGEASNLVGEELNAILQEADYRIFNLEVPLTDVETPISKCGPALIASTNSVAGYKSLGVDCLTIANNHIMDQGDKGFYSTIRTLGENEIEYVGGGPTPSSAAAPKIIEIDSKNIGIYACAEHEFSIVSDKIPGANPFDPLESLDHIVDLKTKCDYVIVLYHGGKEHYRYPSPNLQKVCRKMVEKGADLVVCQHSHCIGCEEKYKDGTIVYGQGNFLFDYQNNEFWQTGLLVEINDDFEIRYIPVCKNGSFARLAEEDEKKNMLDAFYQRSEEIRKEGFVEKEYAKFATSMKELYLSTLSGIKRRSFWIRVMNRLSRGRYIKYVLEKKYDTNTKLAISNFIECEAHRELLLRTFGDIAK